MSFIRQWIADIKAGSLGIDSESRESLFLYLNRWKWLLIGFALIGAWAGFGYEYLKLPSFKSEVFIELPGDLTTGNAIVDHRNNLGDVLRSKVFSEQLLSNLKGSLNPAQLAFLTKEIGDLDGSLSVQVLQNYFSQFSRSYLSKNRSEFGANHFFIVDMMPDNRLALRVLTSEPGLALKLIQGAVIPLQEAVKEHNLVAKDKFEKELSRFEGEVAKNFAAFKAAYLKKKEEIRSIDSSFAMKVTEFEGAMPAQSVMGGAGIALLHPSRVDLYRVQLAGLLKRLQELFLQKRLSNQEFDAKLRSLELLEGSLDDIEFQTKVIEQIFEFQGDVVLSRSKKSLNLNEELFPEFHLTQDDLTSAIEASQIDVLVQRRPLWISVGVFSGLFLGMAISVVATILSYRKRSN